MLGRLAFFAMLMFPVSAGTPSPGWELVPTGWVEVNLCLKECPLKAQWATGYEYRERKEP